MYIEDKTFSVLLTEDELRLYSEFLEEREYASIRQTKKLMKQAIKMENEGINMLRSGMSKPEAFNAMSQKYGKRAMQNSKKMYGPGAIPNYGKMTSNAANNLAGAAAPLTGQSKSVLSSKLQGTYQSPQLQSLAKAHPGKGIAIR